MGAMWSRSCLLTLALAAVVVDLHGKNHWAHAAFTHMSAIFLHGHLDCIQVDLLVSSLSVCLSSTDSSIQ